jgi:signal transduction histidine kinase
VIVTIPLALPDTLLGHIADGARQICKSDWCAIGLLDLTADTLRIGQWSASPPTLAATLARESSEAALPGLLRAGGAYRSSRPGGPFPSPDPRVTSTSTAIVLPIQVDGRVEGLVCAGRCSPGGFTDRDQAQLGWLAEQAARTITQARLLEEAHAEGRRRRRTADALTLMARATSRPFDIRALGQQIVDTLLLLLSGARVTLYARDPTSGGFRLIAIARRTELWASEDVTAPEPGPVEALAVSSGRLVSTPDFLAEPRLISAIEPRHPERVPIRAMLATPLLHGDAAIGILSVADRAGHRFDAEEVNVFLAVADHAAVALQSAYLHAQVTEAALVQERLRIANELHDTLSQLAFSVGLKLDWCLHRVGGASPLRARLEEIGRDTGQMMAQIRQLIGHLAAEGSGEMTFPQRLASMADDFRELTGAAVEFSLEGDPARLAPASQEALQKTLQEALVNVAKHARATRVTVRIEVGAKQAAITVADNGVGLPAASLAEAEGPPGHIGLRQMRERIETLGGRLEIVSAPGSGVCVRGAFPLE